MRRHASRACALIAFAACIGLLAGCGATPPPVANAGNAMQQEAVTRAGDVVIRASALPTLSLGETVARQYGIERDAGTVMLLVGVREGESETALTARIVASATDLMGKRQAIAMREIRTGELVDYVGIADVAPPETLRFDLRIAPSKGPPTTLQFNRDFFAR